MSKTFKDIKKLFAHIEKQKASVLKNEIAKEVVETMQDKVNEEVYDKYDPLFYDRTGKLLTDIDVEVINDNTISIENVRFDSEENRDIAEIVESGIGYKYGFIPERMKDGWKGGARPFTEATREELKTNGKLNEIMKKGLSKRGINTQ